ncbi:hypothetical protein [Cohnella abietis]|uniref:Uncharacterized protein n=1 Tax=Cohnella abietis TaxID=2507935 RepID=A0A3T1DF75_9BACL|nr:hypothetical protein [Cohnella abietis]BBI36787.1 hypothetical protein KCTCHS21_61860 [Cohnella abietis]
MKKTVSIVLFLCLILNLSPAYAADQTSDWKSAYKNYILKYVNTDYFTSDSAVVLVDIDRDGVPELFGGESYRTVNRVDIAYTFKKGKAAKVTQKGGVIGESPIGFDIGIGAFLKENLKVYKDKKTGAFKVIGTDSGGGIASWSSSDILIQLNGTIITIKEISNSYTSKDGQNENTEYRFNGKAVKESQYTSNRKQYFSQLTGVATQANVLRLSDLSSAKEKGISYEATVNQFLQIKTPSLGTNIYPQKALNDKKELMKFFGNFPETERFDLTAYKDQELVNIASTNTTKYGIGPLAELRNKTVVRKRNVGGESYNWDYYPFKKALVDKYFKELFGVVPKQIDKDYFSNGVYYFPSWEAGGGGKDTPQIDGMYALGKGLFYVELTRYYTDMEEYDSKKWKSFGDFQYLPMNNWSKAIKDSVVLEKEGIWHAIIRETNVNGKKGWNLVKYQKGKKLTKAELDQYIKKLK